MKHFIGDTITMSGRVIRYSARSIDTVITTIAMPVIIMLMFVYIFGGAMKMETADYVNFIVPGILVMCIGYGMAYSALRVNMDLTRGVFDRFRSMPIAKASILGGHVLSSVLMNCISSAAVILVAFLMGFRPQANIAEWLLAVLILVLSILAMTWMAVMFGLLAKSNEGAGVFSYVLLSLMFVSSAFVPTDTMGAGLRAFAEHQPMTPIIESVRSLLMGNGIHAEFYIALAWCAGIAFVFCLLSMAVYKRKQG